MRSPYSQVGLFIVVLLPLTLGFAVGFAVIMPRENERFEWYEFFGNAPIWSPFWGLHGAFDTITLENQVGDEWPTRVTVPVLLWVYQFIATVVLVNLLIAQMADTYSNITSEGQLR